MALTASAARITRIPMMRAKKEKSERLIGVSPSEGLFADYIMHRIPRGVNYLALRDDRLFVGFEVFERFAGPLRHAVRRIFGEASFHAGAAKNELGDIAQKRTAARHRNAVVDDVGGELRRRLLEDILDCAHHRAKLFADGADDLIGPALARARESREMIATLHHHGEFFLDRHGGADLDL